VFSAHFADRFPLRFPVAAPSLAKISRIRELAAMLKDELLKEIDATREFFLRGIRSLDEADSNFAPSADVYTVAAQVVHVAQTVEWFREGTFGAGFDMNFAEHDRAARACKSLREAIALFHRHVDALRATVAAKSQAELDAPFAPNPIMQGARWTFLFGVADHTAHHRGSLAVYTRLLGKVPPMPYADM